jgi:hypothetical protein
MDHFQFADEDFLARFLSCELEPQLFNHEAHLRLGWVLVRKHGVEKATEILCSSIERFDRTFDEGIRYDRGITVASAQLLAGLMAGSSAADFPAFLEEFPRLRTHFREMLDHPNGTRG